uniref:Uncharacterized protein n=1 Tax=Anguilla anguilla TaxID=7936 RepID=A0A0E9UMR9_ANGAN
MTCSSSIAICFIDHEFVVDSNQGTHWSYSLEIASGC